MYLLIVLLELIVLFLFSRSISRAIFTLFFHFTHSQHFASRMLAFVFFPGTFIHEMAHFLMAKILFVRTGEIELMPEMHGDGLKLGSVQIAHTDPFRRFLIGVAPLLVGGAILVLMTKYYLGLTSGGFELNSYFIILTSLFIYSIFVIANTMFSSKKDMEGALALFIFVAIILIIILIAGKGEYIINSIDYVLKMSEAQDLFGQIAILLLFPLGINAVLISIYRVLKKV